MKANQQLVEVWGDTVNRRALWQAIALGALISVSVYELAQHYFSAQEGQAVLLKGYAMLAGLGGCLLSGFICSLLYRPQRIVHTNADEQDEIAQVIAEIIAQEQSNIPSNRLPESVQAEMCALGLAEPFAAAEAAHSAKGAQS